MPNQSGLGSTVGAVGSTGVPNFRQAAMPSASGTVCQKIQRQES